MLMFQMKCLSFQDTFRKLRRPSEKGMDNGLTGASHIEKFKDETWKH